MSVMKPKKLREERFAEFPKIGAQIYNRLIQLPGLKNQTREVAKYLTSQLSSGKILDIGTGPGWLLKEVYSNNPGLELFGLDISSEMINVARKNTTGIPVNLKHCTIQKTNYPDNYFDLVTCVGSFYLWKKPIECLNEVFRILKERQKAFFFETYHEIDQKKLKMGLKINLQNENIFLKIFGRKFLKTQLRLTYRIEEYIDILKESRFASGFEVEKIILSNLPIFVRISLQKG
jgi:ubiquinone/menaquinone biosynthesis C-methylase UbiE